jgi:hypothetical protein
VFWMSKRSATHRSQTEPQNPDDEPTHGNLEREIRPFEVRSGEGIATIAIAVPCHTRTTKLPQPKGSRAQCFARLAPEASATEVPSRSEAGRCSVQGQA